jgi:Transposase DDE domain group 1
MIHREIKRQYPTNMGINLNRVVTTDFRSAGRGGGRRGWKNRRFGARGRPRTAEAPQTWANVKILIRGDSGFCRDPTMAWCEANNVDYTFGLAQNPRLLSMIAAQSEQARRGYEATKQPARVFADLRYRTLDSWSRERRVVAKAEHLEKGANPRFVATSLAVEDHPAKELYEETYCARGEMENRIKEQQLHLFADRTSAATMRANQIRLFFSSVAYTLLEAFRRLGLAGTSMAQAQCQTIRLRLLKIGALVQVTVRKVWVRLASSCPSADVFRQAFANLDRLRSVMLRC